jgi:hypothetical protein
MKKMLVSTLFASLLAVSTAPAWSHVGHGQPQFGGIVAEAGEAQFEIVGQGGKVVVHVTNHGQPLDTAAARGKLTVLAGTAKQEIRLQPAGANRLEGQGSLTAGAKLLLQVDGLGQKTMQARAVAP